MNSECAQVNFCGGGIVAHCGGEFNTLRLWVIIVPSLWNESADVMSAVTLSTDSGQQTTNPSATRNTQTFHDRSNNV